METQFSDDTVRERNEPNQVEAQQEVINQVATVNNAEMFRHLRIPRNENAQREMDSMRIVKRREEAFNQNICKMTHRARDQPKSSAPT